jgi:hypothetical protein
MARAAGFGVSRTVPQRDTIPAHLWHRAGSLHPSELAVLFHGTVTGATVNGGTVAGG